MTRLLLRLRALLPALAIALAALAAFAGSLRNNFTSGDLTLITPAEPLLRAPTPDAFLTQDYFQAAHEPMYRPVVTFSYVLDYRLGGRSPLPYHLQSLLWHVGSALLVWALARKLLQGGPRSAAVLGGLFFAVHPALTEAVDSAASREEVLAAFFTLAAVVLALRNTWVGTLGSWLCYATALLSKEIALAMPLLLLGARLCAPSEHAATRRRVALELGALAGLSAGYLFLILGPLHPPFAYAPTLPGGTLGRTLVSLPLVFARYLRLVVAPWPLIADYAGFFDFGSADLPAGFVPSLLLLLAFLAITGALARRQRSGALGLLWFLLALTPLFSPLGIPPPVAERFLYLPLAGLAVAVASGFAWLSPALSGPRRNGLWAALASAGVAFVVLANNRHPVWHDPTRLLLATVHHAPNSWSAHGDLGELLKQRGELDRAVPELEQALRLAPDQGSRALLQRSLGDIYLDREDFGKAAASLSESIRVIPHPASLMKLGSALDHLGDRSGAAQAFESASKLDPKWTRPLIELARLHRSNGDLAGARQILEEAQKRNPYDPSVHEALQAL